MNTKIFCRALLLTPIALACAFLLVPETVAQDEEAAASARAVDYHKLLRAEVGKWDVAMTVLGEESTGIEKCRMVGEFWLLSEFECDFFGQEFEGVGLTGYDEDTKKFTNVWVDNSSARRQTMEGTVSADGKVRTFIWKEPDPATGAVTPMRGVHEMLDADHRRYKQYSGDSAEPMMVADYVRKK